MAAELLIDERHVLDSETFVEIVVWRVPRPVLTDFWRDVEQWRRR
jgi:hypothetical protein